MLDVFLGLFLMLLVVISVFSGISKRPRYQKSGQYGKESITLNGETVKSRAEKRLADYFKSKNIKYVYEPGLRGIYADPDFYLPEYDVYVEYWGLLKARDTITAQRYEKSMRRKMAIYYKNNIKFISIYPGNLKHIEYTFPRKFTKVTGQKLH